ncbi:MAG TPA: protein kinase [Ktedonobacterales bacterium]
MADRVGQQLGKYQLTRLLGKGGFAEVYLGVHSHLETEAAIKVLHAQLVTAREVDKFRQEARDLARLTHQNIVRVLDFDVENETPYLVLDYAPNGSLRQRLPSERPIPPAEIVPYLTQIAEALQYAHDQHLIHRDIKPQNMLLGRHDEVLLTDFGIAVVAQSTSMQKTQGVAGTAAYMAPEQLQGKPRIASDQYGLGIVVYEWLAGERPFQGSFTEVASQHLFTPAPPLRGKIPAITPAVEQVVMTALAKDPKNRFGSVRAFANAFRQASRDTGAPVMLSSEPATLPVPASQPAASAPGGVDNLEGPTLTPASKPDSADRHEAPTLYDEVSQTNTPPAGESAGSGPAVSSAPTQTPISPPSLPPAALFSAPSVSPDASTMLPTAAMSSLPTVASTADRWANTPPSPNSFTLQPVVAPSAPVVPTPSAPSAPPEQRKEGGITRRAVVIAGGAGIVLIGGGAALLALRGQPGAPSSAVSHQGTATRAATPTTNSTPTPPPTPTTPPPPIGTVFTRFSQHSEDIRSAVWSPNSALLASCSGSPSNVDHTVRVWDATNGSQLFVYSGHSNEVRSVAWSPDGSKIASASFDHTVQVFDAKTGTPLLTYRGHTAEVRSVSWSPDSKRLVSGGSDTTVQVWDATSGQTYFIYRGHTDVVYAAQWSPNGSRIASGSVDQTAQVWDVANGANATVFRGHSGAVLSLAWSSDSARLVSGSVDHSVKVWDQSNANLIATYQGHTDWVWCVAWSGDKQRIASASIDSHVLVWNTSSNTNVYTYTGHSGPATTVAWSADGQRIASGGSDRTVQVWQAR